MMKSQPLAYCHALRLMLPRRISTHIASIDDRHGQALRRITHPTLDEPHSLYDTFASTISFFSFWSEIGMAAPVRFHEDEVYIFRKHPPLRGARWGVVRGIRVSGESTAFLDGNALKAPVLCQNDRTTIRNPKTDSGLKDIIPGTFIGSLIQMKCEIYTHRSALCKYIQNQKKHKEVDIPLPACSEAIIEITRRQLHSLYATIVEENNIDNNKIK